MAIYLQKTFYLETPPEPPHRAGSEEQFFFESVDDDDSLPSPIPFDSDGFKSKNDTGQLRRLSDYGTNFGPKMTECNDGEGYVNEHQYNTFCFDGYCKEPEEDGDHYWKCDCDSGECKSGERFTYPDECSDNCFHGSCQVNAGEDGVYCTNCPRIPQVARNWDVLTI